MRKRRLPIRRHTVQALRNARCFEEIAHGQTPPPSYQADFACLAAQRRETVMPLKTVGVIEIPNAAGSSFDHGAFDPKSRRVFIAHTGRDCVEVIDHDGGTHIATLPGFKEAAGVVAAEGIILVTNRGAASLAWIDALTL